MICPRSAATTIVLLLILLSGICSSAMPASESQPEAMPVRQADAVCGACHRKILESYLKTPMANASGLAVERLLPGSYRDPTSGVQFTISNEADGAWLRFATDDAASEGRPAGASTARGEAPSIQGMERLKYFLGSGHIGLTYLYEKNGYLLESPVAFYQQLRGVHDGPWIGRRARDAASADAESELLAMPYERSAEADGGYRQSLPRSAV